MLQGAQTPPSYFHTVLSKPLRVPKLLRAAVALVPGAKANVKTVLMRCEMPTPAPDATQAGVSLQLFRASQDTGGSKGFPGQAPELSKLVLSK